ncbi:uncharacterized protein MELLADRAFT_108778 [Melampsora larici-populina 98AG31]|uniref:Uncharacterized protein n=1 Tax=Melampsora larici-populina (strain 98AG31 / pathotype 3-4-7) TaxID=747676 RepID=F4RU79_MELLP|nr:uncharacterized protein MELLADRAFT_108778 [Melampsora larici-populina 98AG31]EGG04130.1 hypothetical protein MELLADRAFT_108778 [Melampsora larici-populina 98AG31]
MPSSRMIEPALPPTDQLVHVPSGVPMQVEVVPDLPVPPIIPMELDSPPSTPPGQLVIRPSQQNLQIQLSPVNPVVLQKRPGWEWQPLSIPAPQDISSAIEESNILEPGVKRHRANLAQRQRAHTARKLRAKAIRLQVKNYEDEHKLIDSSMILRTAFTPGFHLTQRAMKTTAVAGYIHFKS